MIKIGVTGGIGSGKSLVCKVFSALGVPVYHADDRAKQLVHENRELRENIIAQFGPEAYLDNKYNRKYIASIVFADKKRLADLNQLIHPVVSHDFSQWTQINNFAPYVVEEAAILFESGGNIRLDGIIVVDAPIDIRIKRVSERDNLSYLEIKKRIDNQWPADKIKALADWIIDNDNNKLILPHIIKIHNELVHKEKEREK